MSNRENDQQANTDTGIQMKPGVPLVDKNGNYVGKVKEVQKEMILVDRSIQHCPDLRVPFEKVSKAGPEQIELDIAECDIDRQGW
jgi:hypothetical protein